MGGVAEAVRELVSVVADCGQVQVIGHCSDQVRHVFAVTSECDVECGFRLRCGVVSADFFIKNALSHLGLTALVVSTSQVLPRSVRCGKGRVQWLSNSGPRRRGVNGRT